MTQFAARPFWVLGIVVLLICLVVPWVSFDVLLWLLCGGVIGAVVSLAIPTIRHWRIPFLLALSCAIASCSFLMAQNRYSQTASHVGQTVFLQVQVQPHSGDSTRLKVVGGDLPKGVGLVLYNNSLSDSYEPYENLSAYFSLLSFENQGLMALQTKASDVWFAVTPQSELTRSAGKAPWTYVFYRIRRAAVTNIQRVLPKGTAAVVSGVCFGEDNNLSFSASNAFRTCGVTHLFSVSGLHMAVLATVVLTLLKKCRMPHVAQSFLVIGVLWSFMLIVGVSASVLRAGVLCTFVLLGNCFHRQADSKTSLGLALLLLLVRNPFAAYDIGLLLSFASTYGLLMWAKPLQRFLLRIPHDFFGKIFEKAWRGIAGGVAIALAAMFATAPILVFYFGKISLVSIPSNLLVMLPAEGILFLGCLACLIVPVFPFVGNALLFVCGILAKYIVWICDKVANFSFATVSFKTLPWLLWLASVYVLLAVGWLLYRKRGVLLGAAVSVSFLCVFLLVSHSFSKNRLIVQSVPVGTDLAAHIQADGCDTVILSVSSSETLEKAAQQLKNQGVYQLDFVIFLGGKPSVVAVAPKFLNASITAKTQCFYADVEVPFIGQEVSQTPLPLGKNGKLVFENGFLQLTVKENRVVFAASDAQREQLPSSFENASLLFFAGQAELTHNHTVLSQPLPSLVLKKGTVYSQKNQQVISQT